jgi:hypothetical protein
MTFDEQALKKELAKRGFESASIRGRSPDGRIEVEANKLHPLPIDGDLPSSGGKPLYAPIPVTLLVALDKGGRIESISGGTPDAPSIAAAASHVRMLRDTQQLADPSAGRLSGKRTTHAIEVDREGRQVVRRKRFSIS